MSNANVAQILRDLADSGTVNISALVIREAAGILDSTSELLGQLAECFGDDEVEFADIAALRVRLGPYPAVKSSHSAPLKDKP